MALKQMGNQNELVRARRLVPTVLVYFIATALFLAYGFVKRSRAHYDDFVLNEIEIFNPATMHAFEWLLLVAFWMLLLLSLVSFKTKWLCWPVFSLRFSIIARFMLANLLRQHLKPFDRSFRGPLQVT